jgi:Flp pilus assembly protein, ATPase CpaE
MSSTSQVSESLNTAPLAIAVISPDPSHRDAAIASLADFKNGRIREFITYPPGAEAVAHALRQDFDIVIIDLDSDPEYALRLIEMICTDGSTSIIAISEKTDPDLMLRCMRAGAREFLPMPITSALMSEALVRVSAFRVEIQPIQKAPEERAAAPDTARGKSLLFMSAKGGSGVTTLACGLAVSLAQEFNQRTLLIDMTLPLGDAALSLGIRTEYSTINALRNFHRLDGGLLQSMVVQHESGLYVLPAPSDMTTARIDSDAVYKLLRVAREEFDYVVVDAGSRFEVKDAYMADQSATIFLVTQLGIPELRNSNRLMKQLIAEKNGPKVEIVVNRFDSESTDVEEGQVEKALNQPIQWKIPNDYAAVRRMQNMGTPLNKEDSSIARAIRQMSESICGVAPVPGKKKKLLGLF